MNKIKSQIIYEKNSFFFSLISKFKIKRLILFLGTTLIGTTKCLFKFLFKLKKLISNFILQVDTTLCSNYC